MKRIVFAVFVAAALCGCVKMASMLPPSREKEPRELLAEENKNLKKQLDAEIQVNHRLAYELEKARIEVQKAEAGLTAAAAKPAETVQAFQDFEVAKVDFGMLTGPADWDGAPGYDGIMVFLLPRDTDGSVIKRRGSCSFDLIDVTRGDKAVMTWAVPSEVIGSHWQSVPASFRIKLPWQGEAPYGDDCVLRASFTDAYARTFTATTLFKLKPKPKDEKK